MQSSGTNQILFSLALSILLFVALEIVSRTVIPALGFTNTLFPFHIIFIIFCALHVNNTFLPFIILFIHMFHGVFSTESWAHGTINGIVICLEINFLKNVLNVSSKSFIIMVSAISTLSWYLFNAISIYIQSKNINFPAYYMINSLIEIITVSTLAPLLLNTLNKIWKNFIMNRINR